VNRLGQDIKTALIYGNAAEACNICLPRKQQDFAIRQSLQDPAGSFDPSDPSSITSLMSMSGFSILAASIACSPL
jgi:hypothetical protein